MSQQSVAGVLDTVRSQVCPSPDEISEINQLAEELMADIRAAAEERGVDCTVTQAGSTARGTFVSGDRDIDLFVQFPRDMHSEMLERLGLEIGLEVLPDPQTEYASHPYTKGEVDGFEVEIVPCHRMAFEDEVKSAVDRTPLHTQFLSDQFSDGQTADVALLKQFLKTNGVYGSDVVTNGFSGLLTELLVLEYGSFENVLKQFAALDWGEKPHMTLRPGRVEECGSTATFRNPPMLVVDPIDVDRNVAANLEAEQFAKAVHYAREFLQAPSVDFFDTDRTLTDSEVSEILEAPNWENGAVIRLAFPEDAVVDTFVPQMKRTLNAVIDRCESYGFSVYDSHVVTTETHGLMYVEYTVTTLPARERHHGPPVLRKDAAENFLAAYEDSDDVRGPAIEGDRYVVEIDREHTTVGEYLNSLATGDVLPDSPRVSDQFTPATIHRGVTPEQMTADEQRALARKIQDWSV